MFIHIVEAGSSLYITPHNFVYVLNFPPLKFKIFFMNPLKFCQVPPDICNNL